MANEGPAAASFQHIPLLKGSLFNDAYFKSLLQKWDMVKGSQFHVFRYSKYYHKMQARELALDLLNDPGVQDVLQVMVRGGSWVPLNEPVINVDVEVVPATLTRLDVFDRLLTAEPSIIRQNGDISKCFDDAREGFQISDHLREMLLVEESENADLYAAEEKSELLWRLFEHLALGGACCQFEDKLEPYLDAVKKLYKELLSVQRNASTGKLEVASYAYRINSITTDSGTIKLFPHPSRNSFCYVTVDPLRRLCRVWYHSFLPFW